MGLSVGAEIGRQIADTELNDEVKVKIYWSVGIFETAEENKKEEETCSSYKFHVLSNLKVLYAFSARNSLPLLSDSH